MACIVIDTTFTEQIIKMTCIHRPNCNTLQNAINVHDKLVHQVSPFNQERFQSLVYKLQFAYAGDAAPIENCLIVRTYVVDLMHVFSGHEKLALFILRFDYLFICNDNKDAVSSFWQAL